MAAAKRADPNSELPSKIEHILAGLSIATDPTAILEGVFAGSIAANAIGQLIDRHGKNIARMSYRDSSFRLYGDPRRLPPRSRGYNTRASQSLCAELLPFNQRGSCVRLVTRLPGCASAQKLSQRRIRYCNEDLTELYEKMAMYGRTFYVREAGRIAKRELGKISLSPIPQPKPPSSRVASQAKGFVLIQVGNHPNRALSIKRASAIKAHYSGKSVFRLCNFLHGGLCGGHTVVTPNGKRVTAKQSPVAQIAEIRTFKDYNSARAGMCQLVSNVRANRLSAGFSGDYRGRRVTLDVSSIGSPC